jgi:hypothetical protein
MPAGIVLALALGVFAAGSAPPLPSGNGHFRLGMSRAQVDSAVSSRGMEVISGGLTFLACRSDDPAVEYEQYSFFPMPHGMLILWKVTIGYRLDASAADFAAARDELKRLLGKPASDSWAARDDEAPKEDRPGPSAGQAIWADPLTTVQLGARWSTAPDRNAERMMLTWTDRRLQRLVEARRKRDRASK